VITVDMSGSAVVVTGGTRGLGKAIGLEFARAGASVTLTHRWGSADEAALRDEFRRSGLGDPHIVESDASDPDATRALMQDVRRRTARLAAVISNVAFTKNVRGLEDLKRGSLELSLRYSTWPIVDLLAAARESFGAYPRYAIAVSTDGGVVCHPGYDMAGIAKAALEALCRYLALRLRSEGVRVNAIRAGFVDTASSRAMFGDAVMEMTVPYREDLMIDPRAVGRACVALCSGLMDSVSGQVIGVDEAASLISPITYLTGVGWPGPLGGGESPGEKRCADGRREDRCPGE
jgi:NAD(P)-dependent dehydrogenase (short-subunit alcohol dehydrogenase family)